MAPFFYERPIQVKLKCIDEWVDERTVEFVDIEEDFEGKDVLTFRCPQCGEQHRSRRIR